MTDTTIAYTVIPAPNGLVCVVYGGVTSDPVPAFRVDAVVARMVSEQREAEKAS